MEENNENQVTEATQEVSVTAPAKKKLLVPIILAVVVLGAAVAAVFITKSLNTDKTEPEKPADEVVAVKWAEGISVVPTMRDEITSDSAYCATFQLVWNDMKNEVVKRDIVFDPQLTVVENLNRGEFTESMLSADSYYKKWGYKTLALKTEIENGIKAKFDETSDVLDNLDWSDEAVNDPSDLSIDRLLFYVMLKKKFEYPKEFSKLSDAAFGKYSGVKYFGIDGSTENVVGNQISVLYYNSQDDFAVAVDTKGNDEIIYVKNPKGANFKEIYDKVDAAAEAYTGKVSFQDIDQFKAPNMTFDVKRTFDELAGKEFPTADGRIGMIMQAIQTIRFSLDKKGGEVKSEAVIDMDVTAAMPEEPEKPRYFYVDDTFALFLREKGQTLPYLAARVDDITKYQE